MQTQTPLNSLSFTNRLVAAFGSLLVSTALLGGVLASFDAQTQAGPASLVAAASATRV